MREITRDQAKALIVGHHYLGYKGFRFKAGYGLFVGDYLVGAAVYHGPSAPETVVGAFGLARTQQEGIWELGRLVLDPAYNGQNFGSMLISRSLKLLRKQHKTRAIITYADSSRHYGAVYQATNFTYYGLSAPKKDFYRADGSKLERGATKGVAGEWRPRPQKPRYMICYDKALQPKWEAKPYFKNNYF